jgi:hypothetical protein
MGHCSTRAYRQVYSIVITVAEFWFKKNYLHNTLVSSRKENWKRITKSKKLKLFAITNDTTMASRDGEAREDLWREQNTKASDRH